MDDKKIMLALAAVSGAAVGFLIGARFYKAVETCARTELKSDMRSNVNNPLFKYVRDNSLRQPETLSKLKEVRSSGLIDLFGLLLLLFGTLIVKK